MILPSGRTVPCPNLYAQLNALQLVLDPRSLVWLNLFALDLRQSLEQFMEIYKLSDSQKPDEHVDIKVDGLMLKVNSEGRLVNFGHVSRISSQEEMGIITAQTLLIGPWNVSFLLLEVPAGRKKVQMISKAEK